MLGGQKTLAPVLYRAYNKGMGNNDSFLGNRASLLIHEDFVSYGLLAVEGSSIELAGVAEIDLGECEDLEQLREVLAEVDAPTDGTARVAWEGQDWLLTVEDWAEL